MANVTRGFEFFGDRYQHDFGDCSCKKGWAQLDTRQDGNWINPLTLKLFSYCEGDITATECDDEADFIATVRECIRWHQEREYFLGIDGMCSEPIIAAFQRMGLGEFLH